MAALGTKGAIDRRFGRNKLLQTILDKLNGGLSANLKTVVVTGGEPETALTATGIATDDNIVSAIFHPKAAEPLPSDVTSEVTISAAGKVELSTTDTTSGRIVLTFYDISA